jgi:hypothetical protein
LATIAGGDLEGCGLSQPQLSGFGTFAAASWRAPSALLVSLSQAVPRNIERFPDDFMFQLSEEEFVVSREYHRPE